MSRPPFLVKSGANCLSDLYAKHDAKPCPTALFPAMKM